MRSKLDDPLRFGRADDDCVVTTRTTNEGGARLGYDDDDELDERDDERDDDDRTHDDRTHDDRTHDDDDDRFAGSIALKGVEARAERTRHRELPKSERGRDVLV